MVVEGEAGMGKTTFLWNVAEAAAAEGFRVLSTAGALTEARYAYAAVADLLEHRRYGRPRGSTRCAADGVGAGAAARR